MKVKGRQYDSEKWAHLIDYMIVNFAADNLSQFAAETGLTRSLISQYRNNSATSRPSEATCFRIIKAYPFCDKNSVLVSAGFPADPSFYKEYDEMEELMNRPEIKIAKNIYMHLIEHNFIKLGDEVPDHILDFLDKSMAGEIEKAKMVYDNFKNPKKKNTP